MDDSAKYFIVQYMRDPFRREAKNVGVIVASNGNAAGKFLGETDGGGIDGRIVKWMPHPEIYRRWVKFWREQIHKEPADNRIDRLMRQNGGNYNVIEGGFVTEVNGDSAELVCQNLYSMLVDESADQLLIGESGEIDAPVTVLRREITHEFRKREIMAGRYSPEIHHPIFADTDVVGKRAVHRPAYQQNNGRLSVMETVNFATPKKNMAKDHAGWAAKMFDDIVAKNPTAEPIAIVRANHDELTDDKVVYSLALLTDSARIVNWLVQNERNEFLREREQIALASTSR